MASSVGVLSKLILDEEVGRVTRSLSRMILDSFRADRAQRTQSEIKRRFDICIMLFKRLRGEYKYSLERALDSIPTGLRSELDGIPWEPSTRPWWFGHEKGNLDACGIDYADIAADDSPLIWTPERARYGVM